MAVKKVVRRSTKRLTKGKKPSGTTIVSDTEKYRDLFNRASAGIFIVDPRKGRIIDSNSRLHEILDFKHKRSFSIWDLKQKISPNVLKDICRKVLKDGTVQMTDIPVQRNKNDIRYCAMDAATVMDGKKKVVQVILRDTTERKTMIDELKMATGELEQQYFRLESLSNVQSEFLLNFTGECQTHLNSIVGFSDVLLEENRKTFKPEHQMQIEAIRQNGVSMLRLIDDVMDWSKILNGKMQLKKNKVHLASIVQKIKETIEPLINERKIEFTADIPDSLPTLTADPKRVQQIIFNLVDNALKFTEQGHVRIRVSQKNNKYLEIIVEDTGIGIHPNHLETIFEPFRQISSGIDPAWRKGVGLGLSITKRLVELHKGEIKVQSQLGEGTKFVIRLPHESAQTD